MDDWPGLTDLFYEFQYAYDVAHASAEKRFKKWAKDNPDKAKALFED